MRIVLLCFISFKIHFFVLIHNIFIRVLPLYPESLQKSLVAAGQSTIQSLLFNDTEFESLAYSMVNTPGFTNRDSLTSRFQDAILDLTQLKTHAGLGLS